MGKRPSYQWYPGDWKKDPAVQALSPEAKAFWREALDVLFEAENRGEITATADSWARLTNLPITWVETFLRENVTAKTANVVTCNGLVTIVSRRIKRDESEREKARKRVQKCRAKKANVTTVTKMKQPSSSSSSSSCTKVHRYNSDFAEWWLGYPNKQGRTSAERYYALRRDRGETKEELLARRDRYKAKKAREGSTTFANGATFLNPKPQGTSANIDDFTDDNFTAAKSCATCINGQGYCKYLKRTPDPNEGPCEHHQEAK